MRETQTKSGGNKKTRASVQQKRIRLQQVIMATIGIIVVLAMVLALMTKY